MNKIFSVEDMKQKTQSPNVTYTKFSIVYSSRNQDTLYCFFEGKEDKRYYGLRLKLKTEMKIHNFNCNGKDKVEYLNRLISTKLEYKDAKTLFFVDKDYSNDITKGSIYVTPCYSIENFYTSEKTLKYILTNEFELDEKDNDYKIAIKLYIDLQNKFHNEMLFFNAWLSCQNDVRVNQGLTTRLSIDDAVNTYFHKLVKDNLCDMNDLSDLNNKETLENSLFPDAPKISEKVLHQKILTFTSRNKQCDFRGKFELKLIVSFLQRLKNELCSKESSIFDIKHKCSFTFEVANSISTLSQYAETPICLNNFLKIYKKSS